MWTETVLRKKTGEAVFESGRDIYLRGEANIVRVTRDECHVSVWDGKRHQVCVTLNDFRCDCGERRCAHGVSAVLLALEKGQLDEICRSRALAAGPSLMEAIDTALPENAFITLLPVLFLTREGLRLGLKIGEEKLYVIKHIPHFMEALDRKETVVFGRDFELRPEWMDFSEKQNALLNVLFDICATDGGKVRTGTDAKLLLLTDRQASRVLEQLRDFPFQLISPNDQMDLSGVADDDTRLSFYVSGTPGRIRVSAEYPALFKPLTSDFRFVFTGSGIAETDPTRRSLYRTLYAAGSDGEAIFEYTRRESAQVMTVLLPYLMRSGEVTVDEELDGKLLRLPLRAQVFLDKCDRDVTCRVTFKYGEIALDPFNPVLPEGNTLLLRDVAAERAVLDELALDAFHIKRGNVYLTGSERVYAFVTEGAARLAQKAEVFFSNEFRRFTPRRPRFHGVFKLRNGKMMLELSDGENEIEDLLPLMEALRERRSYFRYKDGTFIDLSDTEDWAEMAAVFTEAATRAGGPEISVCWSAYLKELIDRHALNIELDEGVSRAARLDYTPPPSPVEQLRPYQDRGYRWLMSLRGLGMGGILADDMGLGKTVQALAALQASYDYEEEQLPSLLVAPTSLTYNWLSECQKFTPRLKVMLLNGAQSARADIISDLKDGARPDLVITSYPLIRRDISLLQDIRFKFIILDEAQQIKNVQSIGAHAVKQLNGQTRIALTGTPMENHAGELWSIFDFVLPGYLPGYTDFLRRWGEGKHADELLCRIRPFLMRRLKGDVLSELPDKNENTLMAEMPPEQRRVYDAALLQKRARLNDLLGSGMLPRSRAEVLSAITELRQICCHPRLCLPEYAGASAKLDMLMDILPPMLRSGRRALVFSQFTSMLHIIEDRLKQAGIPCLYLDGETPAAERVSLVNRFNGGETNVFLASLKAGGTGLNLTGADLVIHYDPWWNPTAEDQATGRAHRIGQTRTVDVLRLVAHNSIEEQVIRMGERKRRLFDKLITPGEEMPTTITNAELLALFDEETDKKG